MFMRRQRVIQILFTVSALSAGILPGCGGALSREARDSAIGAVGEAITIVLVNILTGLAGQGT